MDDIRQFLEERMELEKKGFHPDLDLTMIMYGDDMAELVNAFADRFQVNMSRFKPHYHSREEDYSIAAGFYTPKNEQVRHIPITPQLLLDSANAGRWWLEYPDNDTVEEIGPSLRQRGWGLIAVLVGVGVLVLYYLLAKYM